MKSEGKIPPHTTPSILAGSRQNATPYNISEGVAEYAFSPKKKRQKFPAARRPGQRQAAPGAPAAYRPGGAKAPRLRGGSCLAVPAAGPLAPTRPTAPAWAAYRPGRRPTAPARRRRRRGLRPRPPGRH